jgi:hypothetical protein
MWALPQTWVLQRGCYRGALRLERGDNRVKSKYRGNFCEKLFFWKILISKPGLWVNPAMLTPVNNGLVSRGVK